MGHDVNISYIMVVMVFLQVITAYNLRDQTWTTILIVAYCFGGVVNHSMSLALHEVGHNLAFGHSRPMWNRIIGFIGNCIIGIPVSISFKRYHQDHHRYQVSYKNVFEHGQLIVHIRNYKYHVKHLSQLEVFLQTLSE